MRISDGSSDGCSSDRGCEMPCGQQCAYCGSDRALPEALFQSTNRDFFSGYKGNILHDWIIYDPRELVNLVDQYATEDGIAFDPAVRSASASSVIDEKVRAAYVMASLDTEEIGRAPCRERVCQYV